MVPAILNSIAFVLNAGEESAAQEALELFIEVAEAHPRFLRRQLGEVLTAMLQVNVSLIWCSSVLSARLLLSARCLHVDDERGFAAQIAEAERLEESTRQLAAEFLVTLCEAREKAPGMMRKLPQFVGRLFQCLLNFLLNIEVRNLQPVLSPRTTYCTSCS